MAEENIGMLNDSPSGDGGGVPGNIRIGIIGGAGYTAGELLRILVNHPNAAIGFVHSNSNAGNLISDVHQDLVGETAIKFTSAISDEIDLLFLCLGHGASEKFLAENNINPKIKIIDLANDFRLKQHSTFGIRHFTYGLPELNKTAIQSASNIANPGCFATAIQLGLLPLANAGLLPAEIYTTGITGSTGAGQSLAPTSHFSWRANNIQAYKTLTHQHLAEIYQSLHQLQITFPVKKAEKAANGANSINNPPEHGTDALSGGNGGNEGLNFVPWRGDFTRGIFVSSQLKSALSLPELNLLYNDFYNEHPFTTVTAEPLFLKQVVNTNKCIIQLEKIGSNLVVHAVIDNLIKGASGQAIQNMNIMFGLEESTGLKLKAGYF
jgi:N-acetyl-gamma-glutamyl-phosphate reductase